MKTDPNRPWEGVGLYKWTRRGVVAKRDLRILFEWWGIEDEYEEEAKFYGY